MQITVHTWEKHLATQTLCWAKEQESLLWKNHIKWQCQCLQVFDGVDAVMEQCTSFVWPELWQQPLIIIMEIYDVPKLSRYMTALGTYNSKSFTYKVNPHTHARTHACTHTHTHTHTQTERERGAHGQIFAQRKICQKNKDRKLATLLKEIKLQNLSKYLRVRMAETVWKIIPGRGINMWEWSLTEGKRGILRMCVSTAGL